MIPIQERWCATCDTGHDRDAPCPGPLNATAPERVGWRVAVQGEAGLVIHGVMIARAGAFWRARVVTFPDTLWRAPGSASGLKFVCLTPTSAESQAKRFILDACRRRGHRVVEMPVALSPGDLPAEGLGTDAGRATRYFCSVPTRWIGKEGSGQARSTDASEGGLFVATDRPLAPGSEVRVDLSPDLDDDPGGLRMEATVVWRRLAPDGGRPAGMGLRLQNPSRAYLRLTELLRQA